MTRYRALIVVTVLGLVSVPIAHAQQADSSQGAMIAATVNSLAWSPIEVPGFPTGLKIAAVQGNPAEAGAYTLRLSFPDGYQFPPHFHPKAENLTVISGSFQLAMGGQVDDSRLETYNPGDYLFLPATMPHFGRVRGATVVQLHGQGPFIITVVQGSSQ